MKKLLYYLIFISITVVPRIAHSETYYRSSDSKYSILGTDKEKIFATLDSSPVVAGVPVVSSATTQTQEYEVLEPTTTVPQAVAGTELLEFLDTNKNFFYSKERWQQMVQAKQAAIYEPAAVVVSTSARPSPPPLPPGLSVELPYQSQLFISGRKVIGVDMKSTTYDSPEVGARTNSSSFDMQQQLEVRIKGTVGRKINVDVDFDDTVADKRDISIVYKGDPNEFIQEAAFGDIVMSLPSTEFVGYSRQLFGVKLDTKYKSLRTQGFFSQTKGLSEVKRFTGNTQFNRVTIADTAYIGLKYYDSKGGNTIKAGTMKVYQDDLNETNNYNVVITTATTLLPLMPNPGFSFAGNFDLLVPGQDYNVDYNTGIITFRNRLGLNYVIAIDYQFNNGTWLSSGGPTPGNPLIIKDTNNTYYTSAAYGITNPAGVTTELKTFYSLGNVQIVPDNSRGNFILQLQDLNAANAATILPDNKAAPVYPTNVFVDFINGVFNFLPANGQPLASDLYTLGTHRYNILTEYRYRIKIINLRPGIVPQSERVTMNSRVLKANEDYFIDYDAGIMTLYKTDQIDENTVIDVSYDYAPFGGATGSTLIGIRSELSLTKDIFVGTSFVYDFAAQGLTVPDIRSTPSSLMVGEVDSHVKNIKIPSTKATMGVNAEYAISEDNPNIMNNAMVESMAGIKQEDGISTQLEQWHLAPTAANVPFFAPDLTWTTQSIAASAISQTLVYQTNAQQQVLNINYSLVRQHEVALLETISTSGLDFSKKDYMETWINGDGKGEEISISYGTFNERFSNNTGPETEDLQHDGKLDEGEDVGWDYVNPDGSITKIGAGNGRLDTEDFNGNGLIDTVEIPATGCPYGPAATDGKSIIDANGVAHSSVDWTGWKYFQVPLNITSPDDWKNIREVRITIRGFAQQQGSISFATLSLVGNRWLPDTATSAVVGSSLTIAAIGTDDAGYVSLTSNYYYQQLYQTQNTTGVRLKDQSLSLEYNVTVPTVTQLAAELVYTGRPYDFSSYGEFRFFVYSKGAHGDTFFIQAGGDDTDYFEYAIPVPPEWENTWQLITVQQVGSGNRADHWTINDKRATISMVGSPSLANVSQLKVGIRAMGPKQAGFWVGEIHVTDALKKDGQAWHASTDMMWPGSGRIGGVTAGLGRKEIDRNFETFAAGIYNRDLTEDSAQMGFRGLNLAGVNWVPFTSHISRTETVTPNVVQNQNNLLSVRDDGTVTTFSGSADTSLSLGKWLPSFTGSYQRSIIDSTEISQLEDRETLLGNFSYSPPLRLFCLPTSISGTYSETNSYFRVYPSTPVPQSDSFLDLSALQKYLGITDYHTLQTTNVFGIKAPFQFWRGFTFNPSYNINTVTEKDNDFAIPRQFPISTTQDVAASSSLMVFKWLQPSFSYNVNTQENYDVTMDTDPASPIYPSQTKTIQRNANGEVGWNFQVKDIFNFPYTRSLGFSSTFHEQDSDSYENVASSVPAAVPSISKLIVQNNPLLPIPPPGTTTYYTVNSIVQKNDIRVAGRYNPFEAFNFTGWLAPVRTLTTNFTYTGSEQHSYITGTMLDVYTSVWPDLVIGLSQAEKMFGLQRWVSDSQINFRLQDKTVNTLLVSDSETSSYGGDARFSIFKKLDLAFTANISHTLTFDIVNNRVSAEGDDITWSSQLGFTRGKWRYMFRYDNAETWRTDYTGVYISQLYTNTYTGQVNTDISFPHGVPIPFTKRTLPLTNRFIFTTAIKYLTNSSSLNIQTNDSVNYGITSNVQYEVSANFRASLGLGYSRFEYPANSQIDYSTLDVNARMTIQF